MIKYYCNKCGNEIKKYVLKVGTQNDSGEKKSYHLCAACTIKFDDFMKLESKPEESVVKKVLVGGTSLESPNTEAEQYEKACNDALSNARAEAGREDKPDKRAQVKQPIQRSDAAKKAADSVDRSVVNGRTKWLTAEVIEYIEANYESKSAAQIANELNVPYTSVYQHIKKISKPKTTFESEPKYKSVDGISNNRAGTCIALWNSGWTIANIAAEVGHDESVVEAVLRKNGLLKAWQEG